MMIKMRECGRRAPNMCSTAQVSTHWRFRALANGALLWVRTTSNVLKALIVLIMFRQQFIEGGRENNRMPNNCCALTNFAKSFLIDLLFFIIVNHSNNILEQYQYGRTRKISRGIARAGHCCLISVSPSWKARRIREDSAERARLL